MLETIESPTFLKHPVRWLQINLFSSWLNCVISISVLFCLFHYMPALINWVFIQANWVGTSRSDCSDQGACWVFIYNRLNQFIYGFYPAAEQWRVNLTFIILLLLVIPLFIERISHKGKLVACILFLYPIIAYGLLTGSFFGLPLVETDKWGGLMLTLIIAIVGIITSFPIGVLLALGRQSTMPVIRWSCIIFIEVLRGVPLTMLLFMASVMLPLFLPEGMTFDKLARAMIGIALFQSALMAEVIRGGLQSLPKGQYEAAEALGLNYFQTMAFVVLPQTLKMVIPGIVNAFITLFKDTSLIVIIGIFELTGIMHSALTDPEWLGYAVEGYLFAALLYWICCFSMSRFSLRIENKLNTEYR